MLSLLILIVVSYFVGAIPFAYIVGKVFKGVDLRKKGSGNLGSTNAFRVLGIPLGIIVQVLDVAKGFVATNFVSHLMFEALPFHNYTPFEDFTLVKLIAGLACVVGHTYSVFVSFKGGKGINPAVGMLISLTPVDILITAGFFVLVLLSSGYVSLGSIIASLIFPMTLFIRENVFRVEIDGYHTLIYFSIAMSIFLIYNHRSNIKRLLTGREHRFESLWLIRVLNIKAPFKHKQ